MIPALVGLTNQGLRGRFLIVQNKGNLSKKHWVVGHGHTRYPTARIPKNANCKRLMRWIKYKIGISKIKRIWESKRSEQQNNLSKKGITGKQRQKDNLKPWKLEQWVGNRSWQRTWMRTSGRVLWGMTCSTGSVQAWTPIEERMRRWQRPGAVRIKRTGKVESLAGRREDGIPKTKRTRMASGCLEKRSHQADQSNHEENGSRTEGEMGKKLPNDSWMTGFSWPNDAYCACSIAVMRR